MENMQYEESDLYRIQLDDDSFNKMMMSLVLHEVPNLYKTLSEIKRILKPGGNILINEGEAVQTEAVPPLQHRIAYEEMISVLEKNRFAAEVILLNPYYAIKAAVKE